MQFHDCIFRKPFPSKWKCHMFGVDKKLFVQRTPQKSTGLNSQLNQFPLVYVCWASESVIFAVRVILGHHLYGGWPARLLTLSRACVCMYVF